MRFLPSRYSIPLAGLLSTLSAAGCGNSDGLHLASVSGVVTFEGEPLGNAQVEFTPESGTPSLGRTDEEGRFHLRFTRHRDGAMPGTHVVRIRTYLDEDENGHLVPERLPATVNEKSTVIREVREGRNRFSFEISPTGEVVEPE